MRQDPGVLVQVELHLEVLDSLIQYNLYDLGGPFRTVPMSTGSSRYACSAAASS